MPAGPLGRHAPSPHRKPARPAVSVPARQAGVRPGGRSRARPAEQGRRAAGGHRSAGDPRAARAEEMSSPDGQVSGIARMPQRCGDAVVQSEPSRRPPGGLSRRSKGGKPGTEPSRVDKGCPPCHSVIGHSQVDGMAQRPRLRGVVTVRYRVIETDRRVFFDHAVPERCGIASHSGRQGRERKAGDLQRCRPRGETRDYLRSTRASHQQPYSKGR
jgi:hypothetical protein